MARNSLGQFIVQESGSSVVSIKCDELYITKTQYDLFLLDNKEFTELTPTIDKDALINSLTNEITGLNNQINILSTNASGGFVVSVTNPQYACPVIQTNAITYNNQKVYENIGFNDDSTPPNFNSEQSNGLKFWSIPNKVATVYQDANSRGIYNLNANIKFRFKYIGTTPITNVTDVQIKLQFWKLTNGNSNSIGNGVTINRQLSDPNGNIKTSYSQGDVTNTYEINLNDANQGLGGLTDIIYLPVKYSFIQVGSFVPVIGANNFIMEILPDSTFSMLPNL
jgi:hypothetical protein